MEVRYRITARIEFRNHDSLDSSQPQDYIQLIDRRTELIDGCEGCNDEPAFVRALSFAGFVFCSLATTRLARSPRRWDNPGFTHSDKRNHP